MKRNVFYFTTLLLVSSLVSCGPTPTPTNPAPKEVNLTLNDVDVTNGIHTAEQKKLLQSDDPGKLISDYSLTYRELVDHIPNSVHFSWEEENDISQPASYYTLSIWEKNNKPTTISYLTQNKNYDVYNLKINTDYQYKLVSTHYSSNFESVTKEFKISDAAPRNLRVDGVQNVRDLGGWTLENGKTYKQGMIYRTAQFNYGGSANTYESAPTSEGMNSLLNELKIKTEIDLRRTIAFDNYDEVNGITSSPIGGHVNYVSLPMKYGGKNIFTNELNTQNIKAFFTTLTNPSNYPIAFHCLRGTDRTGALAYALGALVGMSELDLLKDYLFSDLANIGNLVYKNTIYASDFFVTGIKNSSGSTLSEKTKNYLYATCGVEESTLNTIIGLLTE